MQPKFADRVEGNFAMKRQRYAKSEALSGKRPRYKEEAPKASKSKAAAASEVEKRHLIVALIDRSDPFGQLSQSRWSLVEIKLLNAMFAKIAAEPGAQMPTFDGDDWFNGVKTLK